MAEVAAVAEGTGGEIVAEFSEVIQQKKRMCNSVLCCKCDIYRLCGEDLSKCTQFINNNPKKAEEVIMSWAAEHKEPVYPTWFEWFKTVVTDEEMLQRGMYWDMHIPADIAQKLGLEPKEGK